MAPRLASSLLLPALAALLLAAGCGDGGGGDQPATPTKSVLGTGHRVSDVMGPADWFDTKNANSTNCAVPVNANVYVTGVTVMAVDRFDETASNATGNLYVQDTTKAPGKYQ